MNRAVHERDQRAGMDPPAGCADAGGMSDDARWDETMPAVYDRILGPALFAPFAEHLAAVSAPLAPRRVLEIAAGTGVLTRALTDALPDSEIIATDLNPGMVSWGRERVPGARWQVSDAQTLDYADHSFDLVVCQPWSSRLSRQPSSTPSLSSSRTTHLTSWHAFPTATPTPIGSKPISKPADSHMSTSSESCCPAVARRPTDHRRRGRDGTPTR